MVAHGASFEGDPWVASSVDVWVACQVEEVEWRSVACVGVASLGGAAEALNLALNLKDQVVIACPSRVDLQEAPDFHLFRHC